ncbi:MAG: flagellar hook-basal body complex protein, partial [Thermoleophilia bacterium]|nr:flagellar hook-basal body complex protein [Thermoleophilia bacterium]
MLRSMYTAISGLRNHQSMLDTVANNIANVNTTGFKGSNTQFKTLLSQTMAGAGAPSATLGGTNAKQVGLGMTVDSITQNFTQGNLQTTGVNTDIAISGDGFFQVTNDPTGATATPVTGAIQYMRAGNFKFDAQGTLVTSDGSFVLGYGVDPASGSPALPGPTPVATVPPYLPLTTNYSVIDFNPATQSDPLIGNDGTVTVADPSVAGGRAIIGFLALARFSNPSGLHADGANKWSESLNSGTPVVNTPT